MAILKILNKFCLIHFIFFEIITILWDLYIFWLTNSAIWKDNNMNNWIYFFPKDRNIKYKLYILFNFFMLSLPSPRSERYKLIWHVRFFEYIWQIILIYSISQDIWEFLNFFPPCIYYLNVKGINYKDGIKVWSDKILLISHRRYYFPREILYQYYDWNLRIMY